MKPRWTRFPGVEVRRDPGEAPNDRPALPEVKELLTWGHPASRVGKRDFAVLDEEDGELGIALKVGLVRRDVLLADAQFQPTPYAGHRGWLTLRLVGSIDWTLMERLLEEAYREVADARMIKALDVGGPRSVRGLTEPVKEPPPPGRSRFRWNSAVGGDTIESRLARSPIRPSVRTLSGPVPARRAFPP